MLLNVTGISKLWWLKWTIGRIDRSTNKIVLKLSKKITIFYFSRELWTNNVLKIYWKTEFLVTKLKYWKNWQKYYHMEIKSWSTEMYTGCGRKNTPHLKIHSFSWRERTVVMNKSSNSGVRTVFDASHDEFGRTTFFCCGRLNLKWWFICRNRACISHPIALGRREVVLIRKRFTVEYESLGEQEKFWKLWRRWYERKLVPLHQKWISIAWTTTRVNNLYYLYSRPPR